MVSIFVDYCDGSVVKVLIVVGGAVSGGAVPSIVNGLVVKVRKLVDTVVTVFR